MASFSSLSVYRCRLSSAVWANIRSKRIREREPAPGWKQTFLLGWAGMRGVVSLASALAIPMTLSSGESFPHRNMILFITFCVILSTLVVQGITLPWIIRWLKHITNHYPHESKTIEAFGRLKARYERMVTITDKQLKKDGDTGTPPAYLPRYRKLLLELVDIQRQELSRMRRDNEYSEELLRNKETELDLEEARFRR